MKNTNRLFIGAFLATLLAGCAPPSGGGDPEPFSHGSQAALQGTWTSVSNESFPSDDETVTYTSTLSWTFDGTDFSSTQVNSDYSDDSPDETFLSSGTVTYYADNTIKVEETEENYAGNGWTALSPHRIKYHRNLVIGNTFHPSTWVRIGTGSGIGGTWETPAMISNSTIIKVRYESDAADHSMVMQQYEVDENLAVTEAVDDPMSFEYAWDGSEMTIGSHVSPFRLLAGDRFAEAPLGSSALAPVFTKDSSH